MQRTRRWTHVAQEARRLADLGMTPLQIADRTGVNRSSVQRWMATGKLRDTRRTLPDTAIVTPSSSGHSVPMAWGAVMRATYALDASDEQLVQLAERALAFAADATETTARRLSAMTRFQAIVKQLRLVTRQVEDPVAPPVVVEAPPPPVPTARVDPRALLIQ